MFAFPRIAFTSGINTGSLTVADDVISLGESLKAVQTLLEKAGANVVANMTILAEGDAANRTDIIYLEKLPLFKNDGTVLE